MFDQKFSSTRYYFLNNTLVFYVYRVNITKETQTIVVNMISKNLTAASTKPIILGILKQGNSYGYLIIKKIKELSGGQMQYSDGMLYPVLHRLEKEKLIQSKWVVEGEKRPRKYYEITEAGKEALVAEQAQWQQVNSVLNALWELKS